jgi:hypothetical protein
MLLVDVAGSQGPAASPSEKFQVMRIYVNGVHAALKKQRCYPWRTFGTPILMTPFFFASVMGARHLVLTGDESFESGGCSFPRYWSAVIVA